MHTNPQNEPTTFLPIDDKLARRAMREGEKLQKQAEKEMQRLQRQIELDERNAIIQNLVKSMRDNGAEDQSIQKALPGIAELAKFGARPRISPSSHNPENSQTAPIEEALGQLLSEIEARQVHWLWEKRIPLGKITILDGDPDIGKSLLAIHIAACVTTGHSMPGGAPVTQGTVIIIAPEDTAGDTIRPRLEAAGGDPSRVLLLNLVETLDAKKIKVADRPFSLSQDLELLEEAINRLCATLVILDPLMAVLGRRLDASRDQDVREIFTPLAQIAERTNCAILVIRHLSKTTSANALYRGAGSIGIIAAARAGLVVTRHPYEQDWRILATTKNNLSKKASNLTYQVIETESGTPTIQWLGENNFTLSTLLDSGTTLSLERHQLLHALKNAPGPLGLQEIADLTGQTYTSVRRTLSRMCQAEEITRLNRGLYTTPDHSSIQEKSLDEIMAMWEEEDETSETSETLETSETNANDI